MCLHDHNRVIPRNFVQMCKIKYICHWDWVNQVGTQLSFFLFFYNSRVNIPKKWCSCSSKSLANKTFEHQTKHLYITKFYANKENKYKSVPFKRHCLGSTDSSVKLVAFTCCTSAASSVIYGKLICLLIYAWHSPCLVNSWSHSLVPHILIF